VQVLLTLGGIVLNKDTKKGVPFAVVRIIGPQNYWRNTGTGLDGTWLVPVPVEGTYYVEIRSLGFTPWSGNVQVPPGRVTVELASTHL
jgi:hypothetical protein